VQERQGASGLWSKFLSPGETPLQAAIQVADTMSADASAAVAMKKKCCLLESKWKIKYDLLRN